MILIENVEVTGITRAVYSARNAMNSWDKSDSHFETDTLGINDYDLAKRLCKAGTDHRKFMRMINVTMDITAPLYFFKEFSTYKVGTVCNSCSTMHTIHKKEFTLEDFSCEHLINGTSKIMLQSVIQLLNQYRQQYLDTKNKEYWWQMIQLLPTSYNQKRTLQLNYEVLTNIYHSRRNHKLDEWRDFCIWIETLPYSELITVTSTEGNI